MAERWVANASPVILLAKAEVVRFLPQLCDELVIPAGVVGEVQSARITDAASTWLHSEGQRFLRPVPRRLGPRPAQSQFHAQLPCTRVER